VTEESFYIRTTAHLGCHTLRMFNIDIGSAVKTPCLTNNKLTGRRTDPYFLAPVSLHLILDNTYIQTYNYVSGRQKLIPRTKILACKQTFENVSYFCGTDKHGIIPRGLAAECAVRRGSRACPRVLYLFIKKGAH